MSNNIKPIKEFSEVLNTIKNAREKAFKQINTTLIQLYWDIGKYVSQKVEKENWGKSIVQELSAYIQRNEPGIKGFSARNIWRMKQFYETYKNEQKLSTLWAELSWSHHRRIMSLKTPEEREFYLKICAKERYSVRELERLINTGTFERTMLAQINMSEAVKQLPQSAENIFKDTYILDFLDLIPGTPRMLPT